MAVIYVSHSSTSYTTDATSSLMKTSLHQAVIDSYDRSSRVNGETSKSLDLNTDKLKDRFVYYFNQDGPSTSHAIIGSDDTAKSHNLTQFKNAMISVHKDNDGNITYVTASGTLNDNNYHVTEVINAHPESDDVVRYVI